MHRKETKVIIIMTWFTDMLNCLCVTC
jgi:hypothetical protein